MLTRYMHVHFSLIYTLIRNVLPLLDLHIQAYIYYFADQVFVEEDYTQYVRS